MVKSQSHDPMAAIVAAAGDGRGPAPVHLWNPEHCGKMDLVIRDDGTWWHEGRPISRASLVALFATVLKREGDAYFLVTPAEKLEISVEDVPFLIVDLDHSSDAIDLITNFGEKVPLGPDHGIELRDGPKGPRPYAHVRGDMWGRIDRKTYYRLAELTNEDGIFSSRGKQLKLD